MRFVFVDEILDMLPGTSIEAAKSMPAEEQLFQDHFPGFPVVPGVLLTEMMAQTAGKCLDAEGRPRGKAMLIKIRNADFRKWMLPGQTAHIFARIRTNQDQYATAACRVEVEGQEVCSSELYFSFVPMERFSPGFRDEVLDAFHRKQNSRS